MWDSISLDDYDIAVIFSYIICLIGSLSRAATGFGDAILMHLLWNVGVSLYPGLHRTILGTDDVKLITIYIAMLAVTVQPAQYYINRSSFSKDLFICLCPLQCVMVVVGTQLLSVMSDAWLKPIVGVFCLGGAFFFLGIQIRIHRAKRKGTDDGRQPPSSSSPHQSPLSPIYDGEGKLHSHVKRNAMIAGAVSGLAAGLSGVGGPPLMFFVLWHQLPASMVRSTIPATAVVAGIFRWVYSAWIGLYNPDHWLCYAHVIVGGFVGLALGHLVGKKLSQTMFIAFVLSLLFLAALTMLQAPPLAILAVFLAECVVTWAVHRNEQRWIAKQKAESQSCS